MKIQNLMKTVFFTCLTLTACIYDKCSCDDSLADKDEKECMELWPEWADSDGLTITSTSFIVDDEYLNKVKISHNAFCETYGKCCTPTYDDASVNELDSGILDGSCDSNRPYTCFDAQ